MRKITGFLIILLAIGLVFGVLGCGDGDDDNNKVIPTGSGVDFTNYTSNFSVKVQNNTAHRLVAFATTPDAANLIGGIPAIPGEHGLPKKPANIFSSTKEVVLFLVTEQAYIANKNNLSVLVNAPFATILAYFNNNSEEYVVYPISNLLGGNFTIRMDNNTPLNMELRTGGIHGPILGYAHYGTQGINLKVNSGSYEVYPVFRRYSESLKEIISVYPRWTSGPGAGRAKATGFSLPGSNGETIEVIQGSDYLSNDIVLRTGSAYLVIVNNNTFTGIEFLRGGQPYLTSTGGRFISRGGGSMTFQIDMPKVLGQNDQYEESLPIVSGSFRIRGGGGTQVDVPAFTYESEKIYRLNVTGSTNFDIDFPDGIVETGNIDISNIFPY